MNVYLDYNATSPLDPEVFDAMGPYLAENFANASSIHRSGQEARRAVEEARETIADILGVEPEDLIFTSGGTESDNLALKGIVAAARPERDHLVVSAIEHPAVFETARVLSKRGTQLSLAPVDPNGVVDLGFLEKTITERTALVSLMHVNNEVGVIEPIDTAARITHAKGAVFHSDAVQSFGKFKILPAKTGIDLLSISAHKICGPKGVGALYVRKGLEIKPLFYGGHQEKGLRPGTLNVAAIVGFGRAAALAEAKRAKESLRIKRLRDCFEASLKAKIPGIHIHAESVERIYNTSNISFGPLDGETLLINLDLKNISASAGAACAAGTLDPSPVLTAMGVGESAARSSVRFSLGRFTTEEEIDYTVTATTAIVKRLTKKAKT